MDETWIVIYRADNVQQAHLVRNLLEDHGIMAHVFNDRQIDLGHIAAQLSPEGAMNERHASTRVLVRPEDGPAAYELVADVDRNLNEGLSSPELAELEQEADRRDSTWPLCPGCRRPRHTSCPVCQTAGTSFPEAFHPDRATEQSSSDAGAALMVICPTCDEPFAPEFPARCEWCGHRFPDGWEPAPYVPVEPLDINVRIIATIVGVLLTVAGVIAFFARIVS